MGVNSAGRVLMNAVHLARQSVVREAGPLERRIPPATG
jgi:hypothetical protein